MDTKWPETIQLKRIVKRTVHVLHLNEGSSSATLGLEMPFGPRTEGSAPGGVSVNPPGAPTNAGTDRRAHGQTGDVAHTGRRASDFPEGQTRDWPGRREGERTETSGSGSGHPDSAAGGGPSAGSRMTPLTPEGAFSCDLVWRRYFARANHRFLKCSAHRRGRK